MSDVTKMDKVNAMHKLKTSLYVGILTGVATIPGAAFAIKVWPAIRDTLVNYDYNLQRITLDLAALLIAVGLIVIGLWLAWKNRSRFSSETSRIELSSQNIPSFMLHCALAIGGCAWALVLLDDIRFTIELLKITNQWPW
jgi:TRAP-type C4-dicarboxylate transport system permease small subunit